MARFTLQKLFRTMAFKPKNIRRKARHTTLFLEAFEDRITPALPPPSVNVVADQSPNVGVAPPLLQQFPSAANGNTTINYINPQTVADPVNPAIQVLVATSVTISPTTGTTFGVIGEASVDNGVSWSPIANFGAAEGATDPTDPITSNPYADESSASVAFGRNGEVYFTYLATNLAQTSGAVVFEKGTFSATGLTTNGSFVTGLPATPSSILYQWVGVDPAENPIIAVDNNLPTYTDPVTGATETDTMVSATGASKGVYVAWNGDSLTVPTADASVGFTSADYSATPIFAVVSGSDGKAGTWSNPSPVSADGYFTGTQFYSDGAPQISFSPGSSGAPGALVFTWPQTLITNFSITQLDTDATQPDKGVAADVIPQAFNATDSFAPGAEPITDAIINPTSPPPAFTDTPQTTTVDLDVTAAELPSGGTPAFSLQDLSVELALVCPNLNALEITLVAPNNKSLVLVFNQTNDDGATTGFGGFPPPPATALSGIGVTNGNASEAIFDDTAARQITDPTTDFPYIGTYRYDGEVPLDFGGTSIAAALGLNGAATSKLTGTWKLEITDNFNYNNDPIQYVQTFGLTFSSIKENQAFGTDTAVPTTDEDLGAGGTATLTSSLIDGTQTDLPVSANGGGIPVAPSVAFDTSLGSASPFAGTMYIAYTGVTLNSADLVVDTGVYLTEGTLSVVGGTVMITFNNVSQVNDDSEADNFTEGNRPAELPTVAVDSTTGTVVVAWYDTRLDANATRAAEFIATSTDGGATFSSQTFSVEGEQPFLNLPLSATDIITGTTYNLQPVPTNIPQSGTQGLGIRQSLIVHDGIIDADFAGNDNSTGSSILEGQAVIANGPVDVSGDLGPVTGPSTAGGFDSSGIQIGFTVATDLTITATGATESGSTVTITTTTAGPALFEVGQQVTIAGVGVAKYNGTFTITGVISPTEFTYTDNTKNLAASGGGTVTSAAGQLFEEEYNTHTAADGTQGIDGFVVTFDRQINPDQFIGLTSAQLSTIFQVEYRNPYNSLSVAATQIMVSSVELFIPADTDETDILVHFATPQYAVGTYSYSVGPDVVDQVQTVQTVYDSPDTPIAVPSPTPTLAVPAGYDTTGVVSSLVVPALPASVPPITGVEVTVNMAVNALFNPDSNIKLVLIGPDGTKVTLVNFNDASPLDANFTNTTFADSGTETIKAAAGNGPFDGTFQAVSPLAAFAGKEASGTWTLQVEDNAPNGGAVYALLTNWSLQLLVPINLSIATASNDGATESGSTVTIKTTANGNFAVGQSVTIRGVGVAGYDGTYTITGVPSANSFTYTDATTGLANSGSGTVTNATSLTILASPTGATEAGTTVTIKTSAASAIPLQIGDLVTIAGVGVAGYNGTFTITGVPSTTSFTYTALKGGLAASGGGTATVSQILTVNFLGNEMDDSNDGLAGQGFPISGGNPFAKANGVFSMPTSTTAVPFVLPYVDTTEPLIIPGPHVVDFYATSTTVVTVGSTTSNPETAGTINITLNRAFDAATLSSADVLNLLDPNGNEVYSNPAVNPFTVAALDPTTGLPITSGATDLLQITLPTNEMTGNVYTAIAGNYTIELSTALIPADYETVGAPTATTEITFDRNMNVTGSNAFGPSDVLRITGPAGIVYDQASETGTDEIDQIAITDPTGSGSVKWSVNGTQFASTPTADSLLTLEAALISGLQSAFPNSALTVSLVSTVGTTKTYQLTFGGTLGDQPINLTATGVPSSVTTKKTVIQVGAYPPDPITVTQVSPTDYRDFIIGFPGQTLSGTYSVEIAPSFAAQTLIGGVSSDIEYIDTDLNAGLAVLRGTATTPSDGTPSTTTYTGTYTGSAAVIPAAVGKVPGTASFPITISDQYAIAISEGYQIEVDLNISSATAESQHASDLTAELIAPTGATIELFSGVGNPLRTPGTLWFSNTVLTDFANTPIQEGFQPFDSGPYNPQFPLDSLNGISVTGIWTLEIINKGTQTPNLTSWSLVLPQVSGGTGLGETVADRISTSFEVFIQDPTNPLTQDVWTAVGPQPETDTSSGTTFSAQANATVVDPSDPSGNTVYIAAATGGIWKTTDFLTTNALGPTWIPLIDNSLVDGLNISSIAVFPRDGNPEDSIIYALTGDPNTGTLNPGVGVLRSEDGGATWVLLDSTDNETSVGSGVVSAVTASSRDHMFVGTEGYKIIVDPTASSDTNHDVIVYMALSTGVWRSTDSGLEWTLMSSGITGAATDIVLAAGSAATTGTLSTEGNLQILYASFKGNGIYIANPAYITNSFSPIFGLVPGNGDYVDGDVAAPKTIPIDSPSSLPSDANGRFVIATPALTNNAIEDLNYQGWLYAVAVTGSGDFKGLYMTKDFGQNWTYVDLPEYTDPTTGYEFGTDDYSLPSTNPLVGGAPENAPGAQGNYDLALAVDPTNPNIVYIGGTNIASIGPGGPGTGGFIRVDTTGLFDAEAIVAYNNAAADGGSTETESAAAPTNANIILKPAGTNSLGSGDPLGPLEPYGLLGDESATNGLLNVLRNPASPFLNSTALQFTNVATIQNLGTGAHYEAILGAEVLTDIHNITTFVDPVTGETRLLIVDDEGVSSVLLDSSGNIVTQVGSDPQNLPEPSTDRNGDIADAQMTSATAQPSQLAADIADAMFYGLSRNNGFPVSTADILQTGSGSTAQLGWTGAGTAPMSTIPGNGQWVVADPSGSGTVYEYRWPCCGADSLPAADFFRVVTPGSAPGGIGRTLFLVQPDDNPGTGQGDWPEGSWAVANPALSGGEQAVDPVDSSGLLLSAPNTGLIFRSVNQGLTWFIDGGDASAGTAPLDGSYAQALAFGAPNPSNPSELDNFLYAGTQDGNVFVSFDGGGAAWTEISNGLDGSAVQEIIPDPVRGSFDAYAVTKDGVYYMPDSAAANAKWINVTGNLFSLNDSVFGQSLTSALTEFKALQSINTIAVDWRYAIPNGTGGTYPVLYVGGDGGVFRSVNDGATWLPYPDGTTYSYTDPTTGATDSVAIPAGGYLPDVDVTQLTLSLGNIDPQSGEALQQTGGLNLLTAATFGRGTWVIRLGTPSNDPAIAAIVAAGDQVVEQSGPQVIGVDVTQQPTTTTPGTLTVEFNAPVLASTFTTGEIQLTDSNGNAFVITGVTPIVNAVAPQDYPTVPGSPSDYHNLFQVTFAASSTMIANGIGTGFGQIVVGALIDSSISTAFSVTTPEVQTITDDQTSGTFTLTFNGLTTGALAYNSTAAQVQAALQGLSSTYAGSILVSSSTTSTGIVYSVTFANMLASSSQAAISVTSADISDYAGFAMNQNNNDLNGELTADANNAGYATDDYHGDLYVNPTGAAGNLSISMQTSTTAGDAVKVTVSDLDPTTGLPVTTYTGTVTITTTDPQLAPFTYTFTAADAGTHVFTIIFETAALPPNQTQVLATDNEGTNPAEAYITVYASYAVSFKVTGIPQSPATIVAGTPQTFTVTAVDAYGNIATSYAGMVTLTSTDPLAVFAPMTYTFTTGVGPTFDNGVHTFTDGVTLDTAGLQSITATDATNPLLMLTGSETDILVVPAAPSVIDVTGFPSTIVAGTPGTFTVSLYDPYGNLATNYTGTITLTTSDPQGTFSPPTYTFTSGSGTGFDNGMHTFTNGATLDTAGLQSITATDTTLVISGTESNILVTPAAVSQFIISFPSPVIAGTTHIITITASDPYGNTNPNYTGTVNISTSDPLGSIVPSTDTFTAADNGVLTVNGTLYTATAAGQYQSISATDTTNTSITGTDSMIVVDPAAASVVLVYGFMNPVTAGTPESFTVVVEDPYGNVATSYTGTLHFTSNDPQAVLPANSTVTNGIGTFTATLKTAGNNRTITATDTVNSSITGSQTGIIVDPAAASQVAVTGFNSPDIAGVAHTYTVAVEDQYGNTVPTYSGTIHFTSSDGQAVLPADSTLTNGTGTFTATLKTAGTQSITATDTVNPSITGSQTGIIVDPAANSTVIVTGFPTPDIAGAAENFTVTVEDQYGNVETGYTGTIHFSSTDGQAGLPANTTLTHGTGTFTATLKTVGTQSITASDTVNTSLTGSETGIMVDPAATSQFLINFPSPVVAGTTYSFTVTAEDAYGNLTPTYTGTIALSSSDPQAGFSPSSATYVAADSGVVAFNGTLDTAGHQSITATDTSNSSITGTESGILVSPTVADKVVVTGFPTPDVAGVAHTFTVKVEDQYGNVATGYTGTLHFTSSDGQAVLPANTTVLNGTGTFTATLKTSGTQTITATDTVNSSITGSETGILVDPTTASTVVVAGFPSPDTAGVAHTFTVMVDDRYGNVVTSYTGTLHFTSTDGQAVLPANTTVTNGTGTFTATLKTAGTQSITATDTASSSVTGSETGILVDPSTISKFVISFPTLVGEAVPHSFTVAATDAYGNTAPGYTGTVTLSSSDPQAVFVPTTYTFSPADNSVHTFTGTLNTPGTQSITATDTSNSSMTGTETGIVVTPTATHFVITYPTTVTAGAANSFTVSAEDSLNAVVPTYTGTITLTSSDPTASFVPTTYTFLASDSGVHTFSGTLDTAGIQSVTATDTSNSALKGTDSNILVQAATATTLSVSGFPSSTVAGVPHSFTVTLKDQFGNVATGYLGTVALTTTDPQGTFSTTSYTFTAADAGTHTFSNGATLKTTGTWAISANDAANFLNGTESQIAVTPAAAATVSLSAFPSPDMAGDAHTVTVTLKDAFGNVATGYTGTVAFSSSDSQAVFSPSPYTFTAADAGSRQFSVTLKTDGVQSITVTDTTNSALTTSQTNIQVNPAVVAGFTITGEPTLASGGTAFPITITAVDAEGNKVSTYTGAVTFASSDPYATLPSEVTLVGGVATTNVTLYTPATRSITVTATSNSSLTGTVNVNLLGGQFQPATVPSEYAVGAGTGPYVTIYNSTGTVLQTMTPFGSTFTAGVRVAVADFTLSGHPEIAVGTGPGVTAEVKVIDPTTGATLFDIQPFGTFTGGVFVSEGDIKGDGYADLIITPDQGGGPRVEIYHGGDFAQMANFYGINDPGFRGGARASAGDISGNGYDDLVVSAGYAGGPRISVYDGKSLAQGQTVNIVNDFYAFSSLLRNGAYVAVGDVNGDGHADLIFGAGPGGGPQVEIISGEALLTEGAVAALADPIANLYVGQPTNRGGARVAVKNLTGDGHADLVTGDGDGAGSAVSVYDGSMLSSGGLQTAYTFDAYTGLTSGVFVG